jgi:beta-ureidopropionase / N-carbamoyl-L-amino-acid hydrolase
MNSPPEIDADAVIADLQSLRQIGRDRTGVSRPAYSNADMEARRWLAARMREIGLVVSTDAVGNVVGRDPRARRTILLGSHSDSVPSGGWLDGALGVAYALGTARAWKAASPEAGIDVVSFADEEGRFLGCLGSRAFCGDLAAEAIDGASSRGLPLRRALADAGLSGAIKKQVDPARHIAYLEAHIEQGPVLERARDDIGVVEGIVGVRRMRVSFRGRADHAGTTPMTMREDAAAAMFDFAQKVREALAREAGPNTVWNIGVVQVAPGAANVVPALAEFVLEYRDPSDISLERLTAAIRALVAAADGKNGVAARAEPMEGLRPTAMAPKLVARFEQAALACGASSRRMSSGAGHDGMILASHIPSGMMFVPSIGGRSHDVAEDTDQADIRLGAKVFAATAFAILAAQGV